MSNFTNRLDGIGEFSIGQAKFVVLERHGGFVKVAQTHLATNGDLLPEFQTSVSLGVITAPATVCPTGFWVPQTHSAFDSVKAQIADFDGRQVQFCATCVSNGVTLQNLENVCSACNSNYINIEFLKTV